MLGNSILPRSNPAGNARPTAPDLAQQIICQWGRWRVYATVTRTTKNGIYAKRWNERRQCWTNERRVYPWRGIFTTEAGTL